jgi:hypothetical protein
VTRQPAIQSCTCTMAVAYWGPATAGGGGGIAADEAGVQRRGEIDVARVEFLELDASMGLRSWQGRGPPCPPRPHPPSLPLRWPGPPPPRPQQRRVMCIVIYLTLKRGGKQCRRSVLPPLLPPPQNSSRRNQYEITKSTAKKDCCTSGIDFGTYGAKIPSRGATISIVR